MRPNPLRPTVPPRSRNGRPPPTTCLVFRPQQPEREVTWYDEDGEPVLHVRTDEELAAALTEYEARLERWIARHGDVPSGLEQISGDGEEEWEATVTIGDRCVKLIRHGTGGWNAVASAGVLRR